MCSFQDINKVTWYSNNCSLIRSFTSELKIKTTLNVKIGATKKKEWKTYKCSGEARIQICITKNLITHGDETQGKATEANENGFAVEGNILYFQLR